MVVLLVIPTTQEVARGGLKASTEKRSRPYLKNKPGIVVHPCGPSYSEAEVGGLRFKVHQEKARDTIRKIAKVKIGDVLNVISAHRHTSHGGQ
jgi:hypothetical protein